MPNAAQSGDASVSSRTGPIHSFQDDPDALAAFLATGDDRPVPVFVRSISAPGIVGRGSLVARSVEDGQLIGTVEWPSELEDQLGGSDLAARCEFDRETGRLLRVMVELEDDDEEPEDEASDAARDERPEAPQPQRGNAAMAKDREPAETAEEEDRPATGSARTKDNKSAWSTAIDELPDDPEVLRREAKRLDEARRKAMREAADRRARIEELERAEQERQDATLSEAERARRDRELTERRLADAERRGTEAERRYRELQIDIEVERCAARMGFTYPDTVPRLINRDRLEFEEDGGRVLGVKEAVENLAREKPDLLTRRGGGTPPRTEYARPGSRPGETPPREPAPHNQPADLRTAMINSNRYGRM
jgi:hypothetical protein